MTGSDFQGSLTRVVGGTTATPSSAAGSSASGSSASGSSVSGSAVSGSAVSGSSADWGAVANLLGREPLGEFNVAVRDEAGGPLVIHSAAILRDGTPMPTRFWLVGKSARKAVDRLEAAGGVREAELSVAVQAIEEAHCLYALERDAELPRDWSGARPEGGVGGTRRGVKCLHAHYAWYLAGGPDPVGRWVAQQLAESVSGSGTSIGSPDPVTRRVP